VHLTHESCKIAVLFFPGVVIAISVVSCTPSALPQTTSSPGSAVAPADVTLPDDPSASKAEVRPIVDPSTAEGEQTKRICGIIPNFRSVSVDAKLPPLSAGSKFKLMFHDSFDYSSFIYVGILAGVAQAQNSYPEFHQGALAMVATIGTLSPTIWVET
jgi:hypothetical protein